MENLRNDSGCGFSEKWAFTRWGEFDQGCYEVTSWEVCNPHFWALTHDADATSLTLLFSDFDYFKFFFWIFFACRDTSPLLETLISHGQDEANCGTSSYFRLWTEQFSISGLNKWIRPSCFLSQKLHVIISSVQLILFLPTYFSQAHPSSSTIVLLLSGPPSRIRSLRFTLHGVIPYNHFFQEEPNPLWLSQNIIWRGSFQKGWRAPDSNSLEFCPSLLPMETKCTQELKCSCPVLVAGVKQRGAVGSYILYVLTCGSQSERSRQREKRKREKREISASNSSRTWAGGTPRPGPDH